MAALAEGPVGDLVDVGTGTGRMIELLGPAARSAIGVDRSPEMLRLARGRIEAKGLAHARVQAGDFYALPLADAAADTLVLHQVLHFADDPLAALTECARVLRPGGRVLVIDLMPHHDDALASRQRHARLGFADAAVLGWLADAGLAGSVVACWPATPEAALGVTIWRGVKTGG
jgi:ArsR family transcriptional regulator